MTSVLRQALRLFFRLLYNEFAWSYDFVSRAVSIGQWRSWQRAALPSLRGRRVLEIAHGTGDMLLDLAALGFEATGIDLSARMGRIARRKLASRALTVPLARARVQALPFAGATFPSVLSNFPAEFIMEPAAIAEFYRVLQPGGAFVCIPAARITGVGLMDRWARWLFQVTGQSAQGWYAPFGERYATAGFTVRVEEVALPRGVVVLLVAEKPP